MRYLKLVAVVGLIAAGIVFSKSRHAAERPPHPKLPDKPVADTFIVGGLQPLDAFINSLPEDTAKEVAGSASQVIDEVFRKYREGDRISEADIRRYADADDPGVNAWWKVEGRMLQMDGEGPPEAVFKLYETGSGAGYTIRVFFNRAGRKEYLELSGDDAGIGYREDLTLDDQIRDLDGDGIPELVVPVCPWDRGADTVASWPLIYRLEKGKYVNADGAFPQFYETNVLPAYRALLTKKKPLQPDSPPSPAVALALRMEEVRSWDINQVLHRAESIVTKNAKER